MLATQTALFVSFPYPSNFESKAAQKRVPISKRNLVSDMFYREDE